MPPRNQMVVEVQCTTQNQTSSVSGINRSGSRYPLQPDYQHEICQSSTQSNQVRISCSLFDRVNMTRSSLFSATERFTMHRAGRRREGFTRCGGRGGDGVRSRGDGGGAMVVVRRGPRRLRRGRVGDAVGGLADARVEGRRPAAAAAAAVGSGARPAPVVVVHPRRARAPKPVGLSSSGES